MTSTVQLIFPFGHTSSAVGSTKLWSFYVHNSIVGAGGASRELCLGVLPTWVTSLLL